MLMEVGTFIDRVETDLAGLIESLSALTGRTGDGERTAWRRSLPKLSVLLNHSRLQDFHLQLGPPGGISLEYRLRGEFSVLNMVAIMYAAFQQFAPERDMGIDLAREYEATVAMKG